VKIGVSTADLSHKGREKADSAKTLKRNAVDESSHFPVAKPGPAEPDFHVGSVPRVMPGSYAPYRFRRSPKQGTVC